MRYEVLVQGGLLVTLRLRYTLPTCRYCRLTIRSKYGFMLKPRVYDAMTVPRGGPICVPCVVRRLRRRLREADLVSVPGYGNAVFFID